MTRNRVLESLLSSPKGLIMKLSARLIAALCLLPLAASPVRAAEKTLTLASTDWCPYVCSADPAHPGIVTEFLTELLARQGVSLKVEHYPWSRAIYLANKGTLDGLLTASPGEAPGLLLSSQPTWTYQVCFLTRSDSHWEFLDFSSLSAVTLGYVQGYGYGQALDRYLADPANAGRVRPISGNQVIGRLIGMLRAGHVDTIAEDRLVAGWALRGQDQLREAGCLAAQPFYLALAPNRAEHAQLLDQLETALANPANQLRLSELASSYLRLR